MAIRMATLTATPTATATIKIATAELTSHQGRSNINKTEKPARTNALAGFWLNNPGDFLLSHAVSRAVPSAPAGLTSVFGMGTGVTLPTKSPENFSNHRKSK